MEFEWDDRKAATNLAKHGVVFEDAIAVFDSDQAKTDPAKTVGDEKRYKTTGLAAGIALLTIIHTARTVGENLIIRIISARPASRRERRDYDDRTPPA